MLKQQNQTSSLKSNSLTIPKKFTDQFKFLSIKNIKVPKFTPKEIEINFNLFFNNPSSKGVDVLISVDKVSNVTLYNQAKKMADVYLGKFKIPGAGNFKIPAIVKFNPIKLIEDGKTMIFQKIVGKNFEFKLGGNISIEGSKLDLSETFNLKF